MTPTTIAAIAASLSAVAAICSAVAAWRVPHKIAELGSNRSAEADLRARKVFILETMLQHRAMIAYPPSVMAINAIVVTFKDSPKVKDAYKRFMAAVNDKNNTVAATVERYTSIIASIIEDLNLGNDIKVSDLDSFYFPDLLAKNAAVESHGINSKYEAAFGTANNDFRTVGGNP